MAGAGADDEIAAVAAGAMAGESAASAAERSQGPLKAHRYYEAQYPEVEDFVMVEVKRIEEMGAYVVLKEYNDVEGMILLSELSRRRIRSVHKIIRVGRLEVVVVLRVDKEKGYIDLSKRRVTPEDIARVEQKYAKSRAVHLIVSTVAVALGREIEEVYKRTAWPLNKKYGHAYDAFKVAVAEPESIFGEGECAELLADEPEMKKAIIAAIKDRMTPKAVKVRADIEVRCNGRAGVEGIKAALRAAQAKQTEQMPIDVKLIAAPLYVLTTTCTDKNAGLALIGEAVAEVGRVIKEQEGSMNIQQEPRLVKEADDLELADLMGRLSASQMGDDGDDDDDYSDSESDSDSDSD